MLKSYDPLDLAFHALSDGTRRGMLERLSRGPASVSELAQPYASTLAAIHQHVQVLESSGLIITKKVGRTRECQLSRETVARVEGWLTDRRQLWEDRFDRLDALLARNEDKT